MDEEHECDYEDARDEYDDDGPEPDADDDDDERDEPAGDCGTCDGSGCGDCVTLDRDRDDDDYSMFADPGGRSALRAATSRNPRNLPCPTCGAPNRLTPADRAQGYQCDACADRDEGRGGY